MIRPCSTPPHREIDLAGAPAPATTPVADLERLAGRRRRQPAQDPPREARLSGRGRQVARAAEGWPEGHLDLLHAGQRGRRQGRGREPQGERRRCACVPSTASARSSWHPPSCSSWSDTDAGARHRRCGLHRLAPRRRAGRARRRRARDRRPLQGQARPGRGAVRGPSTSAMPRPSQAVFADAPARRGLAPRRAGRRATLGHRSGGRRRGQRDRHHQRAAGRAGRRRARGVRLHRWRHLRRRRGAPDAGVGGHASRRRRTAPPSCAPRSTCACSTGCTAREHAILRLGNVYGPRQDPSGEAGVVSIFAGRVVAQRAADRVRRRPPDARLRVRRRRRAGVRGRRRRRPSQACGTSAPAAR